jgi:hypothetical protein
VKSGIQEYDAYYISGYNRLPEEVEGRMGVLLFDERNEIIFTPKKKSYIPLRIIANSLTGCKIINRNESTSLSRKIFTAGISKSKDKRYLQIDIQEGEAMSLLFDLDDKIDSAYNTISLIRAARDVESDLEDKDEEEDQQQMIWRLFFVLNAETNFLLLKILLRLHQHQHQHQHPSPSWRAIMLKKRGHISDQMARL